MTISVELIEVLERVHEMTELQKTLHREGHHALAMDAGRIAGEAFELLKGMLFDDEQAARS
jgi:hypothetical protein